MPEGPQAAKRIAEELLEQTGKALMSGDFEAFSTCFALPHRIDTFDGSDVLQTLDDMEKRFFGVRSYFQDNCVTDLVRHVIEADFVDEDTIHSSHQTRVLSGTILVQAPFPNLSVLKRVEGQWRAEATQYAIADSEHHNAALCGAIKSSQIGMLHD